MSHDILIRGGLVFDGSGAAGVRDDVAIQTGRIVAIGANLAGGAAKLIDAEGLAVAPGFIDIKTHSDFTLPRSSAIAAFRSRPPCRGRCRRLPII